ncbi:MAG: lysylphosphatidylglycerol synthase transmembrane domain-containing protein [Pseudomonadota bacterium]
MTTRWIKLAVSCGCLAALLWWTDAAQVLARLQGANLAWVAVALAAITTATLSMARRWQLAAAAFDLPLSYPRALREYYLAQLVNTVLPGGVAGDVTRAVRARADAGLTQAAQSVMAERLLGQIAMLSLMFAGFATALVIPGGLPWATLGWIVLGTLAGCAVTALVLARSRSATGRFVHRTLTLCRWPAMQLHGVITTACLILGFYACARATGAAIPAAGWATLIPLILCAMLIPLSVGGWGWREGAAAALFPLIGAPASAGVATGITYGVVLFVAALPAAALLITPNFTNTLTSKGKPDLP